MLQFDYTVFVGGAQVVMVILTFCGCYVQNVCTAGTSSVTAASTFHPIIGYPLNQRQVGVL